MFLSRDEFTRKFVFVSDLARTNELRHVDYLAVENQRYRCSFMQIAHYSISQIIVADTTDNDKIGEKRNNTYVHKQQNL